MLGGGETRLSSLSDDIFYIVMYGVFYSENTRTAVLPRNVHYQITAVKLSGRVRQRPGGV